MELKTRGLKIYIDKNKDISFYSTDEAMEEFCDYNKIPYKDEDIYTNGKVSLKKLLFFKRCIQPFC